MKSMHHFLKAWDMLDVINNAIRFVGWNTFAKCGEMWSDKSICIWIIFCHFIFRCSIQNECARGLMPRSWISIGQGPQQCPSITLTPSEISISAKIEVRFSLITLLLPSPVINETVMPADLYKGMAIMGSPYLKLIFFSLHTFIIWHHISIIITQSVSSGNCCFMPQPPYNTTSSFSLQLTFICLFSFVIYNSTAFVHGHHSNSTSV